MEVNERGAHAEVQEKRIYMKIAALCVCVHFFLYILYINTHFQTTLFLFSFCENIFSDGCACPPFPYSLSLFTIINKRVRVFSIRFRPRIFFSFFSVFLFLLALMYVCRRQMRAYIQKKKD
jgi:hypothetical protein